MKTIKNGDMVVYYYQCPLETQELQESLQIRSCGLRDERIRVCPREGTWHILLRDMGNKTKDTKTLQEALGRFKKEFKGEL